MKEGLMNIKLDYYKVFCIVAECQSFSAAAKRLYMTQPAVSQTIMQLEGELGISLFKRNTRGVVLTSEGHLLYEYIHTAMNLIQAGEQKIKETLNLTHGELKIGVGDTISRFFLLPYLEEFHTKFPNIKLKIINRTTLEQCELLKSGEIDLAICNLPIEDPALEVRECLTIHDIFVGGEEYRKLSKNPVSLEKLMKLPLIFLEKKSNSRQYVEHYLLTEGIKLNPEIELGSHDLLLEFAKINLGISCVVKEFAKDYLEREEVFEIRLMQPIPRRSIGCLGLKSVPLSPASTEFLAIIEANIKNIN